MNPWDIIKATVSKVRGTGFLYVLVAMVAVAFVCVSLFRGIWQYALIGGALVILFAVPAIVFSNLPKITNTKGFYFAALATIWSLLILGVLVMLAGLSTAIFQYPRPIEQILHIAPAANQQTPYIPPPLVPNV
jgi:membrane protease YdiL (CAAX protease family)